MYTVSKLSIIYVMASRNAFQLVADWLYVAAISVRENARLYYYVMLLTPLKLAYGK